MKVLVVCSGNGDNISPFIIDQVNNIKKQEVGVSYFLIKGKGVKGYLKSYFELRKRIKLEKPDVIHAHYGLSGLLSTLQRRVPVVITFHGCDVNVFKNRVLSRIAKRLSCRSIYVSESLATLNNDNEKLVIPCGVDLDTFFPMNKEESRTKMNLKKEGKYVLFSSSFSNTVKNVDLAREAMSKLSDKKIELLELKGYTRNEVALLMNAVDMVLLTSLREGSPQFIKEALSCNVPVVSVNVGDIKYLLDGLEGNYLSKPDADIIARNITTVLNENKRTEGYEKMRMFDNKEIAKQVIAVYKSCIS